VPAGSDVPAHSGTGPRLGATPESTDIQPLILATEACEILRISPPTLYRLMREGELPFVKVGSRTMFEPARVRANLDRHRRGEWLAEAEENK
jgi:excisionase family DNA binding protein